MLEEEQKAPIEAEAQDRSLSASAETPTAEPKGQEVVAEQETPVATEPATETAIDDSPADMEAPETPLEKWEEGRDVPNTEEATQATAGQSQEITNGFSGLTEIEGGYGAIAEDLPVADTMDWVNKPYEG
jgi:hypothetical protein